MNVCDHADNRLSGKNRDKNSYCTYIILSGHCSSNWISSVVGQIKPYLIFYLTFVLLIFFSYGMYRLVWQMLFDLGLLFLLWILGTVLRFSRQETLNISWSYLGDQIKAVCFTGWVGLSTVYSYFLCICVFCHWETQKRMQTWCSLKLGWVCSVLFWNLTSVFCLFVLCSLRDFVHSVLHVLQSAAFKTIWWRFSRSIFRMTMYGHQRHWHTSCVLHKHTDVLWDNRTFSEDQMWYLHAELHTQNGNDSFCIKFFSFRLFNDDVNQFSV